MTPEQHNKYLGIAHLAYGGLFFLLTMFMLIFFGAIFLGIAAAPGPNEGPPLILFGAMWVFIAAIYGAMTIPSLIAGYALLKRKRWAKVAAIIGGVVSAMSFPLGTAVCVYTFWFLFSEPGKQLYEKSTAALPPQPPLWAQATVNSKAEPQYIPPSTPPDWR